MEQKIINQSIDELVLIDNAIEYFYKKAEKRVQGIPTNKDFIKELIIDDILLLGTLRNFIICYDIQKKIDEENKSQTKAILDLSDFYELSERSIQNCIKYEKDRLSSRFDNYIPLNARKNVPDQVFKKILNEFPNIYIKLRNINEKPYELKNLLNCLIQDKFTYINQIRDFFVCFDYFEKMREFYEKPKIRTPVKISKEVVADKYQIRYSEVEDIIQRWFKKFKSRRFHNKFY